MTSYFRCSIARVALVAGDGGARQPVDVQVQLADGARGGEGACHAPAEGPPSARPRRPPPARGRRNSTFRRAGAPRSLDAGQPEQRPLQPDGHARGRTGAAAAPAAERSHAGPVERGRSNVKQRVPRLARKATTATAVGPSVISQRIDEEHAAQRSAGQVGGIELAHGAREPGQRQADADAAEDEGNRETT